MKWNFIYTFVEEESLWVTRVHSADNTIDILMKSLGWSDFLWLHHYLGIYPGP
jgi:hypothetical protein